MFSKTLLHHFSGLKTITSSKKILSLLLLTIGTSWITLNMFFRPFLVWTDGIYRPWLILKGLLPYRDFEWIRTPFDIYLLTGIYTVFGVNPFLYRMTIFLLYLSISFILFYVLQKKSFLLGAIVYVIYVLLTFFLYDTTQIGEIMVSLFILLLFVFFWEFLVKKNYIFLFLSGISAGFAIMSKQTSSITILVLLMFLVFPYKNKGLIVKTLLIFLCGLLVPIIPFLIYLVFHDALDDFFYYSVYFNLFIYRETAPLWGLAEGIKIIVLHLAILIPTAFLKSKIISKKIIFLLIGIIISLFPAILPSYWSYRLVTALPLFSIVLAIFFIQFYSIFKKRGRAMIKFSMLCGLIIFLVLLFPFIKGYDQYIKNVGGFAKRPYTLEFSENQKRVVRWIKNNTAEDERIFNMDSGIVLLYSNRLPHNKYVDPYPWVYIPFDVSYRDIIIKPPRVVIYDNTLPTFWPILRKWKFIQYLHDNYKMRERINDIEIYTLSDIKKN